MARVKIPIKNTDTTITRPVVLDIMRDLISMFGINSEMTLILPSGENISNVKIDSNDKRIETGLSQMTTTIQVEETYTEEGVPTTVQKVTEYPVLFRDEDLDIAITPIYARCRLEFNIRIQFESKAQAATTISELRLASNNNHDGLYHEIAYQYLIPEVVLLILHHIHQLRETQAGYGEDLSTWFKDHFTDQMTTLTNLDDSYRTLAKEEIQTRVLGRYGFEIVPDKPDEEDNLSKYWLAFDYTVEYDKAVSVIMQYPIMVHNLPVDTKFYDTTIPYEMSLRLQKPSKFTFYADQFTNNDHTSGFPLGAPIPAFLKWTPSIIPPFTEGIIRAMIQVDPNDKRDVCNLKDLGYLKLRDHVIDYITKEYEYVTKYKESAVYVALYENDNLLDSSKIYLDSELNLKTTFDLNLRKRYYLWIAILTNFAVITTRASDVLRSDPILFTKFCKSIYPNIKEKDLPKVINNNYITKKEYDKVVEFINSKSVAIKGSPRQPNLTVGKFTLITGQK